MDNRPVKQQSLVKKLSIIIAAMLLVSSVSVGLFGYIFYRQDTLRLSGLRVQGVAIAIADAIDPVSYDEAMSTGQKDEQWQTIKTMVDKVAVDVNAKYLYVVDDDYKTDDAFIYYVEGYNPSTGDEPLDFGYREPLDAYSEEVYGVIETGNPAYTNVYSHETFGELVTAYAPILDPDGKVTGVVGVDLAMENLLKDVHLFGLKVLAIVVAFGLLFGWLSITYINKRIGNPIRKLTGSAEAMAVGNLDALPDFDSNDEIGRLSVAFSEMAESIKRQISVIESLAEGDISMPVTPRSENDSMGQAIQKTLKRLNFMFNAFHKSSDQLAETSVSIAAEAENLAHGAVNQLDAINGLAGSISMITEKAKENTDKTIDANRLIEEIKENAGRGAEHMHQMLIAVNQINDACKAISNVVGTIDSIAFQTNLLALNAAVEAAQAGERGKGFAVVADEVGNLEKKSSTSARETAELIENSLEKAALGVKIANETSIAFEKIVEGINNSGAIVDSISETSAEQTREISDINKTIDRVQSAVNNTAGSARESADAGAKLSNQADQPNRLLGNFKLESSHKE